MKSKVVTTQSNATTPFLARFSTSRTQGEPLPGAYDASSGMWLTDFDRQRRPVIGSRPNLLDLTTKTKVENEEDDTEFCLLEITTKTESNTEKDDQKALAGASLELTTKTSAQMESDDTKPEGFGFW